MTNKRLCRFLRTDCSPQPQHEGGLDAAGAIAGEGLHGSLAGTLLDRSFAYYSDKPSQIDLRPGERLDAHDRRRLGRCEDPALASSSEIASATQHGQIPHGSAMRHVSASSRIPEVESPRGLQNANEGATPLPHWMRATRPSQAGMVIPGLLTALAVLAAANGILSTVLELAWL